MSNLLAKLGLRRPAAGGADAWRLANEGRFLEAVRAAERAGVPDAELAKILVAWRNRAVTEVERNNGPVVWPRALPDPFPDVIDRIPEATSKELTPELVGGAILHHGSLIVRGMFKPDVIETLKEMIDRAFAVREASLDAGGSHDEWYSHAPIPDPELDLNRPWQGRAAMMMADSPMAVARWVGVLRSAGIADMMQRLFGEAPVLSAKKITFYRLPPAAGSQWHQDGAFLGKDIRTVNMWTSLSHCGVDAPGLDIVPWRLQEIVKTQTHGALFNWSVGEGKVEEMTAERPYATPVFAPGDSILFDHLCLHRTGVRPTMTKTRYAIESWMFAPSHYDDKSHLVI